MTTQDLPVSEVPGSLPVSASLSAALRHVLWQNVRLREGCREVKEERS